MDNSDALICILANVDQKSTMIHAASACKSWRSAAVGWFGGGLRSALLSIVESDDLTPEQKTDGVKRLANSAVFPTFKGAWASAVPALEAATSEERVFDTLVREVFLPRDLDDLPVHLTKDEFPLVGIGRAAVVAIASGSPGLVRGILRNSRPGFVFNIVTVYVALKEDAAALRALYDAWVDVYGTLPDGITYGREYVQEAIRTAARVGRDDFVMSTKAFFDPLDIVSAVLSRGSAACMKDLMQSFTTPVNATLPLLPALEKCVDGRTCEKLTILLREVKRLRIFFDAVDYIHLLAHLETLNTQDARDATAVIREDTIAATIYWDVANFVDDGYSWFSGPS